MILRLLEPALLLLVAVLGPFLAGHALEGSLAAAALRGETGEADALRAAITSAGWAFAGAGVLLAISRAVTLFWRRGEHVLTPFALPAAYGALALGFMVQAGYGSPYAASWPGPPFATGVLYAGVVSSCVLLAPGDIGAFLSRARWALFAVAVALVALLAAFGSAPGSSGQTINLWGFQPIEIVKLFVSLAVAATLGARAWKLRWHRVGPAWLRVPRPRLLMVASSILVAGWLALFAVRDFGPTLILAFVFLGLFFVVTRSLAWVLTAIALTAGLLAFFWFHPDLAPSSTLALRLDMWRDPWLNGRPNGDQLALARYALAAGGWTGSGVGAGVPAALPAGHTDLAYAHLVEVLGEAGGLGYLALLGVLVIDGLRVAAFNRTPERVMMATALGLLLAGQAFVILGGTLGLFPLTGVVVPFLSFGKTGTVALLAVAALLVRLGEDGRYRADTEELRELRAGVHQVRIGLVVLGVLLGQATAFHALYERDATTLRGVVTTLGDGTPVVRHDPRLRVLSSQIRRGPILDRKGAELAASPVAGGRVNPLGDQFGTVLGSADGRLARAPWQLERQLDARLRGLPDAANPPVAWTATVAGRPQVVFATGGGDLTVDAQRALAIERSVARGGGPEVRRVQLADVDLAPLLPIARLPVAERADAIRAVANDVESRAVRVSVDAELQRDLAAAVRAAASKSTTGAAAAVLLDADSGEVLARAQWPDFDPGGTAWQPLRAADEKRFMGVYGAWSDKTGAHGVYQAGSVFKVLSSLVAAREGLLPAVAVPDTCPTSSEPSFACDQVDGGRPSFTLPGWSRPIHDHGDGGARGPLDLVAAIAKSSNVWFGQLALKLGPEPYRRLRTDGVEFGNPGLLQETDGPYTGLGEGGSRRLAQTGFGQGAGSWSVMQAARAVAAVANGGEYVRCASTMAVDEPCKRLALLPPGVSLEPILAGMREVMKTGTGARLKTPAGLRVYGKTGTADAPGTADEAPWGIRRGQTTRPHSWFVAIAEPATATECARTGDRYVVAAVVPHGGFGASAAGPLAMDALAALQTRGYLPPPPAPVEPAPAATPKARRRR
jgi:cell division protein FtsW (lipid II flippase)